MDFDIKPFWRKKPFTLGEGELLKALCIAHHLSCFRDNPSSVTVANAADGSKSLSNALAAGLLTIGGKHAPLEETVRFLERPNPEWLVEDILKRGFKVPGWGGTFQKGKPDPIWETVDTLLNNFPVGNKLIKVSAALASRDKVLYPNPSAYTAACAIVIELPAPLAPYLFIASRLAAWTEIASRYLV